MSFSFARVRHVGEVARASASAILLMLLIAPVTVAEDAIYLLEPVQANADLSRDAESLWRLWMCQTYATMGPRPEISTVDMFDAALGFSQVMMPKFRDSARRGMPIGTFVNNPSVSDDYLIGGIEAKAQAAALREVWGDKLLYSLNLLEWHETFYVAEAKWEEARCDEAYAYVTARLEAETSGAEN